MFHRCIFLLGLGAFCLGATAAVPPPEKLLPKETTLVCTAPDSMAAWTALTNSPSGRLWQDPQLKAFKDKFLDKFRHDALDPLERNLGLKLESFSGLARGQATFAIVPVGEAGQAETHGARIFILDVKDRAAQLRTNLADIRQKWAAAGKPMKSLKIREMDFTTFVLSADDWSWDKLTKPKGALPDVDANGKPSTNKTELTFGQSDSLLLVSDSPIAIEKVLTRQSGGLLPALDEQPAFQTDYAARLRGAPIYAWLNIKDLLDTLTKAQAAEGDDITPTGPRPGAMLEAAGLTGLTSASLAYHFSPEGISMQVFVGLPEAKRRGLFKALVAEPKDSNPPPFVPADVTEFWRWRLNIPHSWAQLESMLNGINPQYGKAINFILETGGKDKDEKYDLRSELLGNLGEDIVHYEKVPTGNSVADLHAAPSIYLIGSPNPEKLANALKNGMTLVGSTKNVEFLGRQIYTTRFGAQPTPTSKSFSFAGSGGYLAMSDKTSVIEEYLRSDENKARPLSEVPGLADAAQKVGGMSTGLFGYNNQNASMRAAVEMLRLQPVTLQDVLGSSPVMGSVNPADEVAKLREWTDFSLLPPYDAIAKYFYFSVYSGAFTPEGFSLNYFFPTPPKLRE
jgi:hypothetical protein